MQRRTGGRGLGAVLFTDIVGSTTIAAEMGNKRWGELVSRHHRLIRREIRRFGGREQDTAGDGFFVAFERPGDHVWVLDFGTGLLTRISIQEDRPVDQVSVPTRATGLAVGLGAVWVSHADGTVTKVDPLTVRATPRFARIEGSVRAIVVDAARKTIWVDVRSD